MTKKVNNTNKGSQGQTNQPSEKSKVSGSGRVRLDDNYAINETKNNPQITQSCATPPRPTRGNDK